MIPGAKASGFPVSHARASRPLKKRPDWKSGAITCGLGQVGERLRAPCPPAPALAGVGVSRCGQPPSLGQPPSVLMSTRMPGPIVELSDARFR